MHQDICYNKINLVSAGNHYLAIYFSDILYVYVCQLLQKLFPYTYRSLEKEHLQVVVFHTCSCMFWSNGGLHNTNKNVTLPLGIINVALLI